MAQLLAKVTIDVTGRPRFPLSTTAVSITALGRSSGEAVESGCVRLTPVGTNPQIGLRPYRPASVKIVPLAAGELHLFANRNGRSGQASVIPVAANNPVFVNFSDPRNEYVIGVPGGAPTNICGIGQRIPEPS